MVSQILYPRQSICLLLLFTIYFESFYKKSIKHKMLPYELIALDKHGNTWAHRLRWPKKDLTKLWKWF